MHRLLARSLVAAVLLFTCVGVVPARAQVQVDPDVLAAGVGKVRHIDFSDWLSAQGTFLVAFQGRDSSKPFSALGNLAVVDYAGKLAAASLLPLGTTTTGTVKVTRLPDGTGEVLVNANFSNALTYAFNSGGVRIFGYTRFEVAGGATAALSSGNLQAKYTVPDADNPELNLATVTFFGGGTLTQLKIHSEADGALRAGFGVPEGTPGKCMLENTGVFNTGGGGATADGFPAERVDVRVAGEADLDAVNASPTGTNAPGSTRKRAVMNSGQHASDAVGAAGSAISGSWGQLKARYRDQKATE